MKQEHWEQLLQVLAGEQLSPLPAGFIIDSPWLPNWAGMSILDYYSSDDRWFEANMKAHRQFPELWFLPGFWSEYGMCTEPSAFGARCRFPENEFPFAEPVLDERRTPMSLRLPDPRTDGLAPFMMNRLRLCRERIEAEGHAIRFAVARGPLNIAGFLMGNTEFLLGLKMQPDEMGALLDVVTTFLVDWLQAQARAFPSIDGVLLLDDVVGFCGEDDFLTFAKPCLKRAFEAIDVAVRMFHNDAHGIVCAPHLHDIGVNLFNFSHEHPINEMRRLTGDTVTLLGNIPPRDVLAQGTPDGVRDAVRTLVDTLEDRRRVILSCGGGMPPNVSTENIQAFIEAAR